MNKWIYGAVGLFVLVSIGATVYLSQGEKSLGSRIHMDEITLVTTSTNANYTGITVANVNDFDYLAFTLGTTSSGTMRIACSFQDTQPTIGAATSTSNRWDYVDAQNPQTDTSIDGWTGLTFSPTTGVQHLVVEGSAWKWCSVLLSGNTTPAGYGTSSVYLKRAQNQ